MRRIAAVWVALCGLMGVGAVRAQQADSAAKAAEPVAATVAEKALEDSAAHFQVMFLAEPGDTLVFTREVDAKVFVQRDTLGAIEQIDEEVYDSLDFRNFIPGTPFDLIEDRLSCLTATMPLTYNKTVNSFINFFVVRKRNYTQTMLERKDFYFPIFEEALRRYDLPDELKYLAIVESGLNMRALSRSGAVGLWQFMGPTGRDFKLHQDKYIDERMDPYKATEAACRYLRFLYNQFNDWELALAAYNCGPGSIRRTLNRTGGRTFWEIYNALPQETRSYVPQFTAVVYAMNYAEHHNLRPDADSMFVLPERDTVVVSQQVNLAALSQHLQVDPVQLVHLNPSLRKPVSPEAVPFVLNLPAEAAVRFRAERSCYLDSAKGHPLPDPVARSSKKRRGSRSSDTVAEAVEAAPGSTHTVRKRHTVRRGETLYALADRFGVTAKQIRTWNHLRSGSLRPGQRLTVGITKVTVPMDSAALAAKAKRDSLVGPTAADMPKAVARQARKLKAQNQKAQAADSLAKAATAPADTAPALLASAKPGKKAQAVKTDSPEPAASAAPVFNAAEAGQKVHEVQPGDTLWNISRRYQGLSVDEIMRLNGLKDKNLKVGMRLIVG